MISKINFRTAYLALFLMLFQVSTLWALDISIENKNFWAPGKGTYVETELMILSSDLRPQINPDGSRDLEVDFLMTFKNPEGEIVAFDKYRLNKNNIDSANFYNIALIDKKRFALDPGIYSFQVLAKDVHNPTDSVFVMRSHKIEDFTDQTPAFSDIQWIESYEKSNTDSSVFVKNGLFMKPLVMDYFPNAESKLTFYTEFYHSDASAQLEGGKFLISYSIRKQNGKSVVQSYKGFKKPNPAEVIPVFAEFNISGLPTGNYQLHIEARDRENNLIAEKVRYFQRYNPAIEMSTDDIIADKDFVKQFDEPSLRYQLKSFVPIADADEAKTIYALLKRGDMEAMQNFFIRFWSSRNELNPYQAWYAYTDKIKAVNSKFTTNLLYGFETDRGRVYLQYGSPNQVLQATRQAGSNPYEIWHYYDRTGRQSNVRFVFLNRDLIGNNYELIHSTALGEIKNEQWKTQVQSKGFGNPIETGTDTRDFFGNQLNDFFDQ